MPLIPSACRANLPHAWLHHGPYHNGYIVHLKHCKTISWCSTPFTHCLVLHFGCQFNTHRLHRNCMQTLVLFKTIGGNEKIDSIDPVGKMKGLILSTFERGTTMRRKVNSSLALNKKETPQGIVLLNQK